ncbi:MAG: DNA glycosylase [Eubacteriales bacterium]|jgi:N-glycosylase/DNA lyase|nr:DNA glycosylase [Eubacteriales bacterium]
MILTNHKDFNLKQTFDCGQCFRWDMNESGVFVGVAGGYVIEAFQTEKEIIIDCPDEDFIIEYFDLKRDYGKIKNSINKDEIIKAAIQLGGGIRLLKQEPWETLVSFIISANNNIPRIKKIINTLCQSYGEKIWHKGEKYYTFPSPEKLAVLTREDLAPIKSGFRDKYIIDAAQKIASGRIDLSSIYNMGSDEGRHVLKQIKGVGDKVADCVLLFAYQKFDVFPKDVWIKRIITNLYNISEKDIDAFVEKKFSSLGGFAQQYLFYFGRC